MVQTALGDQGGELLQGVLAQGEELLVGVGPVYHVWEVLHLGHSMATMGRPVDRYSYIRVGITSLSGCSSRRKSISTWHRAR